MAAKKNEVAPTEAAGLPATSWDDEVDTGFENTDKDDFAIPFMKLLQKMNDEVDEDHGAYVDGAKPGMFFNSATQELFDIIDVIPCAYRRAMVEWKPDRGGFVAQHAVGIEEGMPRKRHDDGSESGVYLTPDGNELVDTRYHFCLHARGNGNLEPVVVAMTSTQLKKSKGWMQRMKAVCAKNKNGQPIMHSAKWHLTSVGEENDRGSWKGYKIEPMGLLQTQSEANAARDAAKMFVDVADKVRPPEETDNGGCSDDTDGPY